jgi:hypothetical protein
MTFLEAGKPWVLEMSWHDAEAEKQAGPVTEQELVGLSCDIDCFIAAYDREKRAPHDHLAHACVVRK